MISVMGLMTAGAVTVTAGHGPVARAAWPPGAAVAVTSLARLGSHKPRSQAYGSPKPARLGYCDYIASD